MPDYAYFLRSEEAAAVDPIAASLLAQAGALVLDFVIRFAIQIFFLDVRSN